MEINFKRFVRLKLRNERSLSVFEKTASEVVILDKIYRNLGISEE